MVIVQTRSLPTLVKVTTPSNEPADDRVIGASERCCRSNGIAGVAALTAHFTLVPVRSSLGRWQSDSRRRCRRSRRPRGTERREQRASPLSCCRFSRTEHRWSDVNRVHPRRSTPSFTWSGDRVADAVTITFEARLVLNHTVDDQIPSTLRRSLRGTVARRRSAASLPPPSNGRSQCVLSTTTARHCARRGRRSRSWSAPIVCLPALLRVA